ncbi:N-acetylmuramoyl-L-alanine amidase [Luteimonas sp. 50]|uniref:N-acetylmuramoyl-L-alanine amidase n=1 Tax=Cognatiluteimonas sedimenti TaxID=2927791 RepID=A0ABT0A528_9GAMM|nr:N-acetylmuramoyl-L-alanine amidase [Lysobacter sedimenti]MCJ0826075.1 N-acetylmuramoyl-L-alanine amidase [Lysobacter sedimenti]
MPPEPSPAITIDALPYEGRLQPRAPTQVDLVVLHCTELPDLATAREYGERILYPESGTGNSGHFYIDRDGSVQRWIDIERVAHHVRGHNPRAIGIELVNRGRWPRWLDVGHQAMDEPYPDAQVAALLALLRHLQQQLPALRFIAGHEDLDRDEVPASDDPGKRVRRKRDPGPLFPWNAVMAQLALQRLQAPVDP